MEDIKKHAQAIVDECKRIEKLQEIKQELQDKTPESINLYRYLSQGYDCNMDISINEKDLRKTNFVKIKDLLIEMLNIELDANP